MTTSAFTRLLRILDLEEKQGWRNRAVIGGLRALSERWTDDAYAEAADARIVRDAVYLMGVYEAADPATRPDLAQQMRQVLAGELTLSEAVTTAPPGLADAEPVDAVAPTTRESVSTPASGKRSTKNPVKEITIGPADAEDEEDFEQDYPPPEPTHIARERIRRQQPRPTRTLADLDAPPTLLAGIGSATAEQLARLGINRVRDLLWHLPARHEDYSTMRTIDRLQPGEQATVIANLWDVRERKLGVNRVAIQGILADGTGTLHATWWNKYVRNQLTPGSTMRFSGKVGLYMGQKTLDNPIFEDVDDEMVATGRLAPVYPLTEGVSQKRLRAWIRQALDEFVHLLPDPLPPAVREEYNLLDLNSALEQIHFPADAEQLAAASRRLAFEEFFYVQLGVLQRRHELHARRAPALQIDETLVARFQATLAFALTGAQARVIGEIVQDLRRNVPMTRLVQGDVGSGKTAVAAAAMWATATNGLQAALLAPTQILAEQHHRGISELLTQLHVPMDGGGTRPLSVALLTGRITGSERERVLAELDAGQVDVVIGTTALIQEAVSFANLGLIVVDEQHRFGVEQRGALRSRGEQQPHLLVMSATPIPRSLALTLYGDLDLSIIDEMPPGRMPVVTRWFRPGERERLYNFVRREAKAGRQSFIVYPLVEESDKLDVGSAVEGYERLRKEILSDLRLALLHGRMSGAEKDEIMRAFAAHEYDVLVSTSVIEVGIDIPNASLILIEDAERFGLAQLHQFRGRVGRGQHKSYCALVSKAEGVDAVERLRALEASNNGFVLAEKDLELRGPGDFLGSRQSGLPDLRMAQLSDLATLHLAREAAQKLFAQDNDLSRHPELAAQVARFWRGEGDVS